MQVTFREWTELSGNAYLEVAISAPWQGVWDEPVHYGELHPLFFVRRDYRPEIEAAVARGENAEILITVADNPATRGIVESIQRIEQIETGHSIPANYLAALIRALDALWD